MREIRVPRLWPGGTVCCIASGPSLTREDVECVRGKVRVVAVNDGVRYADFADVLYSSDQFFWPHYDGMPSFSGLKFGMGAPNRFTEWPTIQVLKNTGVTGLEVSPNGLRTGRNSGYAAINLAVHLGASLILLLGYDMGRGSSGQAHFFGDHPKELRTTSPAQFDEWRAAFTTIVEPLRQAGVLVVNCSRETSLEAFPRMPLEYALDRLSRAA